MNEWRPHSVSVQQEVEVIGDDWLLTNPVIRLMDLNAEEAIGVQQTIEAWRDSMHDLVADHIEERPASKPERTAFRIVPFPHKGERAFEAFKAELGKLVGGEKRQSFLQHFSEETYFGNMGRHEVKVEVYDAMKGRESYAPGVMDPMEWMRAEYREIDPVTSQPMGSGQLTYKMFERRFGNVLAIK